MLFHSQISRQGLRFVMFRGWALPYVSLIITMQRKTGWSQCKTFDLFVLFLFPRTSFLYLMIRISYRLSQCQSFKFLNEILMNSKCIYVLLGRREVLSVIPLPLLDFTLVSKIDSRLQTSSFLPLVATAVKDSFGSWIPGRCSQNLSICDGLI